MVLKFYNRDEELAFFEKRYQTNQFEFFVLYGRRRVGKTELIKHFIQKKPHLYYLCDKSGTERNALRLKKQIAGILDEPVIQTNDLEEILQYYLQKTKDARPILVFDEFSYLVEKDSAIPSIFQRVVDEHLKQTSAYLILCGSSISMMEKGVLSAKSALYGRKTAHLKLQEISFSTFPKFFPKNGIEKNIEFYATLGGIPLYLQAFSDGKSTWHNIRDQILDKKGQLYEEVDFLLQEELREPDVYKTILSAIASGKTKVVDIANASQIKAHDIDKYLKILMRLGLIKKEHPLDKLKSKKTIYTLDDNFFAFYFFFSEPYHSQIEIGELAEVKHRFDHHFSAYVGKRFEKLIREEVIWRIPGLSPQRVGRWWGTSRDHTRNERREIEIDIMGVNENTNQVIFGECKWQEKPVGTKIYEELLEKKEMVEWKKTKRTETFLLFSKKGFTPSLKKEAESEKVLLFDAQSIAKLLKK